MGILYRSQCFNLFVAGFVGLIAGHMYTGVLDMVITVSL